jgi:glycosyltransferase involved in cell wall biosynthesis
MACVIHLLPYDGIGGAEVAARSMADAPTPGLDFRLQYIFRDVASQRQRLATFNPLPFLAAARRILKDDPDLLVLSLWRACIVGILVKLLRPRLPMVVLIHNSVDAHAADALFTRIAMGLSREIWVDSAASMRLRFARSPRAPVVVIPFLVRRLPPLQERAAAVEPRPRFVFWGRLAAQKNLVRALGLFARIRLARADAAFQVIGPDAGQLAELEALRDRLGLRDAVTFDGPMAFDAIVRAAADAAFYLQTSDYEGMAMAVVEAMQLGLVPVVTPVGEVGNYCRDGHNAVVVADDDRAAGQVLRLLDDPAAFRRLRTSAIDEWADKPLYREAVVAGCLRLLAVSSSTPQPPAQGNASP